MDKTLTIVIIYNPDLPFPWRVLINKIVHKCSSPADAVWYIQETVDEKTEAK